MFSCTWSRTIITHNPPFNVPTTHALCSAAIIAHTNLDLVWSGGAVCERRVCVCVCSMDEACMRISFFLLHVQGKQAFFSLSRGSDDADVWTLLGRMRCYTYPFFIESTDTHFQQVSLNNELPTRERTHAPLPRDRICWRNACAKMKCAQHTLGEHSERTTGQGSHWHTHSRRQGGKHCGKPLPVLCVATAYRNALTLR